MVRLDAIGRLLSDEVLDASSVEEEQQKEKDIIHDIMSFKAKVTYDIEENDFCRQFLLSDVASEDDHYLWSLRNEPRPTSLGL